jgi:ABC-type multidrug transport system fused ATPase/permease subunit
MRLAIVVLTSLLGLIDPLILKWLIDEILPWRKTDMLAIVGGGFFLLFLTRFGLASISQLVDTYTAQRLTFEIRLKLLRHLQELSADYHIRTPRGDILHRFEQDVDQLCVLGSHSLASLVRVGVMTLLTVTIMLMLNWRLTLFILPLVPLMSLLRRYSHPHLKSASEHTQEMSTQRLKFIENHLATLPQVQLLNQTARERRKFVRVGRGVIESVVRRRFVELRFSFSSQVALMAASATVLAFGGSQVLAGALTVGGLVAFYSYLNRIFEPIEIVVGLYSDLQRANASIRRVVSILQTRSMIVDPPVPRRLPQSGAMAVELRGVRFAYRDDQPVLDGLDLKIEPGEKIALVGSSGSGKSTVARILTRMYDPVAGTVLLDGVPIRDLRLRDVRSQVALVPQDPILFDDTLRANLLCANLRASDTELRRALAIAQLDHVIEQIPEGWLAQVGRRGEQISGGQRQRVAVARAILQDSRLLILDEATSALDGFTEHRLLRSLDEIVGGRTVLVIAHRLSAILWAERIIVLERGRVVGDGTHDKLYWSCNTYRGLCDKQMQREASAASERESEPGLGRMAV